MIELYGLIAVLVLLWLIGSHWKRKAEQLELELERLRFYESLAADVYGGKNGEGRGTEGT